MRRLRVPSQFFCLSTCLISSLRGRSQSAFSAVPNDAHPIFFSSGSSSSPQPSGDLPGVSSGGEDGFYVLMFTCKVCETRTARRISKKGYHEGSVLVRCPGCLGLHLISDHLGFFNDESVDAESILKGKGEEGVVGRVDPSVYEFSTNDLAVLASGGKSVKIPSGEEMPVVTFDGVTKKT